MVTVEVQHLGRAERERALLRQSMRDASLRVMDEHLMHEVDEKKKAKPEAAQDEGGGVLSTVWGMLPSLGLFSSSGPEPDSGEAPPVYAKAPIIPVIEERGHVVVQRSVIREKERKARNEQTPEQRAANHLNDHVGPNNAGSDAKRIFSNRCIIPVRASHSPTRIRTASDTPLVSQRQRNHLTTPTNDSPKSSGHSPSSPLPVIEDRGRVVVPGSSDVASTSPSSLSPPSSSSKLMCKLMHVGTATQICMLFHYDEIIALPMLRTQRGIPTANFWIEVSSVVASKRAFSHVEIAKLNAQLDSDKTGYIIPSKFLEELALLKASLNVAARSPTSDLANRYYRYYNPNNPRNKQHETNDKFVASGVSGEDRGVPREEENRYYYRYPVTEPDTPIPEAQAPVHTVPLTHRP